METATILTLALAAGIWTILALLVYALLKQTRFFTPLTRYHITAATLIALPVGLVTAILTDLSVMVPSAVSLSPLAGPVISAAELPAVTISPGQGESTAEGAASAWSLSWSGLVTGLLILMAAGGILRLLAIYIRLRSGLRRADRVFDSALLSLMNRVQAETGVRQNVTLYSSPDAPVPFTSGLFDTVIVLPQSWLKNKDSAKLHMILSHEMIHISRADYVIHVAELLIRHLFWMHPLVHKLYHQSGYWREVACDAAVLGSGSADAGNYAELLYEFALSSREKPVFKAAMAQEHKLLNRIREIHSGHGTHHPKKHPNTMKKSLITSCGILLLIAGAMACSDLGIEPGDENKQGELTLNGETVTVPQIRDTIANMRDGYEKELEMIKESGEQAEGHRVPEIVKEQIDELNNFLMLIDNGRASRAVAGLEQMMNSSPPPPPSPPSAPTRGVDDVFTVVEEMPQMSGGQMSLYERLTYPQEARDQGLEGRVLLRFIVEKDGTISDLQVARSAGDILDEAAFDAMSGVEFSPGLQRGEPVRVQMVMPIVFRLQ